MAAVKARRFGDGGGGHYGEQTVEGGKEPLRVNLKVATHLCMLMKKYREEIVSVNPPRLVVTLLNTVGKIRGIKV